MTRRRYCDAKRRVAGHLTLGPIKSRRVLHSVTLVAMLVALWMMFRWVPTDVSQGAVQRILYLHVPVAWVSMVAIVVVAFASVMYLRTRDAKWDRRAVSVAEVGLVFGAVMLVSGIVWARPVWLVWWTGEAKLTTALILFLIYVAYLMFRAYFPPGDQRRRISAIIAILGAIDTPIIYYASILFQESHPPAVVGPLADDESAVAAQIGLTLLVSVVAFTLLFLSILVERLGVGRLEEELDESTTGRMSPEVAHP